MKPLLSRKVTREQGVNEWTPADHHMTHDGRNEFMARMQARIAAAQVQPAAIVQIKRKKA